MTRCTGKESEQAEDFSQEKIGCRCERNLGMRQLRVAGYAGMAALLALAFANPLYALAIHAAASDIHSHVLLIPLISGYLLFLRRNELPKTYTSSGAPTLILAGMGLGAALEASSLIRHSPPISHTDYLSLNTFSFVCFLAAGGFVFLGSEWMAAAAFPMAFLIFMVPLPDQVLQRLERGFAARFHRSGGTVFQHRGNADASGRRRLSASGYCHRSRTGMQRYPLQLGASYYHPRGRLSFSPEPLEAQCSPGICDSVIDRAQWLSDMGDRSSLRGIWPSDDP
jgi:hypothetical protein